MSNPIAENRIGRFEVSDRLLKRHSEEVLKVLSDVIITRAEHMIHRQAVEYFGFSKHFDALMEGDRAPYYTAIITEDDVGLSIEWKRGE